MYPVFEGIEREEEGVRDGRDTNQREIHTLIFDLLHDMALDTGKLYRAFFFHLQVLFFIDKKGAKGALPSRYSYEYTINSSSTRLLLGYFFIISNPIKMMPGSPQHETGTLYEVLEYRRRAWGGEWVKPQNREQLTAFSK